MSGSYHVKGFVFATVLALSPFWVQAQENDKPKKKKEESDTVHVIALKENEVPVNFTSSAQVISQKALEEKRYTDIERILTAVPSVQIRSKDGLGLRPNIGIRGSRLERSANITLMEDGTLIAPAAYSASAAYYFPEVLRMSEFEVYKGGSSVQYGPVTTSGILNMVTQPIDGKSSIMASVGSFGERILNTKVSHKGKNAGFVFVGTDKKTDGFRKIDGAGLSNANNSERAGAEQQDYMLKFNVHTDDDAKVYQKLDVKLAEQHHDSDQSYLGLTAEDFATNPHRQYAATQMDNIKAKHKQAEVKHTLKVDEFSLVTKAYHNTFERNWYKLGGISGGASLGNVLKDPTTYATQYDILTGATDATGGELSVAGNNRMYVSEGIQTDASYKILGNVISHKIDAGLRMHHDSEERFQGTDTYDMVSGQMVLNTRGAQGATSGNNRIASANAFAGYIKDTITAGNLTVVPGVRYENIKFRDKRWDDTDRTILNRNNTKRVDVFLPSVSASYMLTGNTAVFGGVHEGFAPPSPSSESDVDNEKSINYELGYRLNDKASKTFFEVSTYFNDYSNLLGTDTLAGAGGGSGAQFNGGKVHAYGLEVMAGKTFQLDAISFPVNIAYTFTNAEFRNTFTETDIEEWGDVEKGDRLPYIARNQFTLNTGVKYEKVSANLLTRFVGKSYANVAQTQKVPSYMIFDAIAHYDVNKNVEVFVAVNNILDKNYLIGYNPYGLRGGMPRAYRVGGVYNF
ncbi:MAG: TonB-dependent receptor [Proteobacteria bacterium]|nr:TonB-dependent receptor [Pseudomonadota bacterium]